MSLPRWGDSLRLIWRVSHPTNRMNGLSGELRAISHVRAYNWEEEMVEQGDPLRVRTDEV